MKRVRGPNGRFGKEINAEVAELPGVNDAVGLCTLLARIRSIADFLSRVLAIMMPVASTHTVQPTACRGQPYNYVQHYWRAWT